MLSASPPIFDPVEIYPLGNVAEPVVAGDLDGDGLLDLINANTGADGGTAGDTVSVLLGRPGAFEGLGEFPAGNRPEGIVLGLFDGDESPDAVTANFEDDSVSVLLGDGEGGFKPPMKIELPGGPRFVIRGDWNSDGQLDLATADFNGGTASVLQGFGTGFFTHIESNTVGAGPEVIASGRLNADDYPDLMVCDSLSNTVTPLINSGTGRFTAGTAHPVGLNPRFLLLADLDSDGLDDVIVANNDSQTVSLERNAGDGTFTHVLDLSYSTPILDCRAPVYLAFGDLDGDGALDLLVTWADSDVFTVFPRTADSFGFGPALAYSTGKTPVGITTADFNADGRVDVAVTNAVDDTMRVYRTYAGSPGVIIDDGQPGTTPIGPWAVSESAPFPYGEGSLFSKDGTRYIWDPTLPEPGKYEVCMWWAVTTSRARAVPVMVQHSLGTSTVVVDQRAGYGLWHSLGTYAFDSKAAVTLIAPNGSLSACADAVRLLPRKTFPNTTPPGTVVVTLRPRPSDIDRGEGEFLAFQGTFAVTNEVEAERWIAATFAPTGVGEESVEIRAARLFIDSDGDRKLGRTDETLGKPLTFASDIRVITFDGFDKELLGGSSRDFFVVCEVAPDKPVAGLKLELVSVAMRGAGSRVTGTVEGLPVPGWVFPVDGGLQEPADANQDGKLDISDPIFLLGFLFLGFPDELPCGDGTLQSAGNRALLDANGDRRVDLSDVIALLTHLFAGGAPPVLGKVCIPIAGCEGNPKCGS